MEDPNTAHYKISNRGSQVLIFYLLVFDRIHDAMHLNKIFRCFLPLAEKQAHNIKDPAVYLTVDMGHFFYPCLYKTHLVGLLTKNYFILVSSDHRSQSHFYSSSHV